MDTRIHTPACLIQRPEGNCDLCTWILGHGYTAATPRGESRPRHHTLPKRQRAGRAQERAACSLAHAQAERLHEQGHALVARRQLLDGPQRLPIRLGIWMGTELDESEDRMVVSLLHIPQVGLIEGYGLEAEEPSEALEGNHEALEMQSRRNQDAIKTQSRRNQEALEMQSRRNRGALRGRQRALHQRLVIRGSSLLHAYPMSCRPVSHVHKPVWAGTPACPANHALGHNGPVASAIGIVRGARSRLIHRDP